MIKNFIKALPSENQYVFKKKGAEALVFEFFIPQNAPLQKSAEMNAPQDKNDLRKQLLFNSLKKAYGPDDKEQKALSSINDYLHESARSTSPSIQRVDEIPQPNSYDLKVVTPPILNNENIKVATPKQNMIAVISPQIMNQAVKENEIPMPLPVQLKVPNATVSQVKPPQKVNEPQKPIDNLKAGFPQIPDAPNIVLGIVRDPRGKVLPNILVEIMNEQETPVRAFKTNSLGQFMAATPLPNGNYSIVFDDPKKQNELEKLKITLEGKIFQPIVATSVDQREKLRRELFGGNTAPQMATT